MCLGSHKRLILNTLMAILIISYSSVSLANPAVITMARLLGSFVAKRAATTEIATVTAASVSRVPTLINAGRLSRVSPLFSKTGDALNWVGLGYGLNALQNDLFEGPKKYSTTLIGNGRTIYASSPEALLTMSFDYLRKNNPTQLSCGTRKICVYGDLTDIQITYSKGKIMGAGFYTATDEAGFKSDDNVFLKDIIIINGNKKDGVVKDSDDTKNENLTKLLMEAKVDTVTLTKMVNELMLKASSQPDYQGIPFSTSDLLTKSELESILNKEFAGQSLTLADLLESTIDEITDKPQLVILPDNMGSATEPDGTDTDDKNEEYPDNSPPDLTPPTAEQIISPLNNVFPFLKEFDLTERQAQCPVAEFDVFEKHYVIDSHCGLFEKISGLLKLFSLIVWSFLGLRIVLSS